MFKMLNALSLNVGEYFAEVSSKDLSYRKNWLLAKKSLTDGLRECLQNCSQRTSNPDDLAVDLVGLTESSGQNDSSGQAKFQIDYFLSQSSKLTRHADFDHLAYFTTAGFEQLFEFSKNNAIALNSDLIFGVSERTRADGSVERSPTTEALEFLATKLELLEIKHIAICFLHSNLNSQNESQIADFFTKKGFEVFCSSHERSKESRSFNELERFRMTLARARFGFRKMQTIQSFEILRAESFELECHFLNKLANDSSGMAFTPLESFKIESGAAQLYLGLESFLLKDHERTWELKLSPTTNLKSGFFHTPGFSNESSTFDPGPMLMGKSFVPTLIDFLFASEQITSLEDYGMNPIAPEKTKARILEAILALVRNNQDRKHIDLQKEVLKLEKILGYKLWAEMITLSGFRKLKVSGPFALAFLKILKSFKPQGIELMHSPENLLLLGGNAK